MVNMMATSNYIVAIFLVVLSLTQYSSTKHCRHPFPGVDKLIVGVDITKLDLIPLKGFTIGGFKSPVIQLTCNLNRKHVSPNGMEYDLPDQVWSTQTRNGGVKTSVAEVLRTSQQVKKKMAVEASVSAGYGPFAFSASASYKKMQDTITNANKEIMEIKSEESSHKTELYTPRKKGVIDPNFLDYVEYYLKGNTFKSNKEDFKEFIQMFGTHYIKSGEYGGIIRQYMETSKSYSSTKTDVQLAAQAELSYNGLLASLSISAKFEKGDTKIDKKFKSATRETITYHGGEANLMTSDGLNFWHATVDKDPVLFTIETDALYRVIKDRSLRSELRIAIDDYVMKSFSKEIIRKLINAIRKWYDPVLQELLHKVKKLQNLDILGRKEIIDMDSKVEYQITPPSWFMKDTGLCLKYQAKVAGHKQCNDEANNRESKMLCAPPNRYTNKYHDNTGKGENGCFMYWGIVSYTAPKWFTETQICFKGVIHDSETDDVRVQYCTPVNNYTTPFLDNTWKSYGQQENTMRWSIVLPKQAPVWLRNSKLCFEWEPHNNANRGQCRADNRKLCARPGEYTAEYVDSTDAYQIKNGGCYMKWGWYLTGNRIII